MRHEDIPLLYSIQPVVDIMGMEGNYVKQPQPQGIPFNDLMSNVGNGLVKIPQFQREFVWTREKSAQLLDSIFKGYPVGTFILWKTKIQLKTVRNIGNVDLPDTPQGDFVQHVLDGQQRLTSLYASVKGLEIIRSERKDDFSKLYVDLAAEGEDSVVVVDPDTEDSSSLIRIVDLLNGGIRFLASYPEEYLEVIDEYKKRIESYSFSTILVEEAPIEVATEIFTRINVTGTPLSVFEIMVAKTFDADRKFDLSEKYEKLLEDFVNVGYETIQSPVILQVVSAILVGECAKKDILRLDKQDFIDVWPDAVEAMRAAVDYFRTYFRIPVSRLLPYGAMLVPFAYFFYHHKDRPSGDKAKFLEDMFWRTALAGRYSYASEGKIAQDIKRVDAILDDEQPTYDYPVDVSPTFIRDNGWFGTNRSFIKAILCLFAYQEPKSFDNNGIVHMSNGWLKIANSRNYHHFFPKAYMKKHGKGVEEWQVNHIANITIVDDFLNKRKIRDKAPATYMKSFNKNKDLARTMKSNHLIDLDRYGVWDNDFELFFRKRCQTISRQLKKRVIPQAIDSDGQGVYTDDFEESEQV